MITEQLTLEKDAIDIKQSKEYNDLISAIAQGRFDETASGNALIKTYFLPIKEKVQQYLDADYKGHTGKTQRYIKYICDDSSVLAYIILQVLTKRLAQKDNRVKTVTMAQTIINSLITIQTFDKAEESNPKLIAYLGSEYKRASAKRKRMLIDKHLLQYKDLHNTSSKSMNTKAGSVLIDIVLHSGVNIIENKKMWRRGVNRHATMYTMFTQEVFDILSSAYSMPNTLALLPPMVTPPIEWTSFDKGGYLTVQYKFMKLKSRQSKKLIPRENLRKAMKVINKLQEVSWRVNKRVLDVINTVYDNNMVDPRSPPTLPKLYGDLPTSNVPDIKELIEWKEYKKDATVEERKEWGIWNRKREQIQIGLDGDKGRRLQYLMTMGVVNKMLKYDKFYYVYQLDYRGRVYPVTDFFNPQSKGYVKSLLEFSEGKILDTVGLYWLKIHIANTYGLDKAPFEDRIEWVDDNRERLLEVARSPLDSLSLWVDADSSYEFLAACMAYEDYVLGLPVHLPIQLDAVNSGVQMYSGLLRDKKGAKSTCVIGDTRSDLYQEVADLVNKKLEDGDYPPIVSFIDKEGVEKTLSTRVEAESMKGKFTRSYTKRNVMTVPYSVSVRGMKMQNWDVMDDLKLHGKQFWKGDDWVVNYIWTTLTYEAIFEIVKGARAGQEYLKEVAKLLDKTAMWHTPIYGVPVLQPALKFKEVRVKTILGTLTIAEETEEVKKQKQLSAIAANFIHSIDATILMYVVDHIGYDIGVIHDCFLVHPNEGERVRDIYKEGYTRVMRADPLKMFSDELDPEHIVEIPYVGDLDLDEVANSSYIIS